MHKHIGLFFLCIFCTQIHFANGQQLLNSKKIFSDLNLDNLLLKSSNGLKLPSSLSNIKIAIFDDGFTGFKSGSKALPPRTQLIKPAGNSPLDETHGYVMAQVFWAALGGAYSKSKNEGPEVYLLHTNGLDNLEHAVDFSIKNNVDIIFQSKVYDWGSNFDGTRLINTVVNRAIDHGIIFINAAGNLHNTVYHQEGIQSVRKKDGLDHVELPGADDTLTFTNRAKGNPVDISLAWSDFGDSKSYASNVDFDLYLFQKFRGARSGEIKFLEIARSQKSQVGQLRPKDDPASPINALALERIVHELDSGEYCLSIIYRGGELPPSAKLRVIIDSKNRDELDFHQALGKYEIAAPADNPRVFTVGAIDSVSSLGPTADQRIKPDLLMPNSAVSLLITLENKKTQTIQTQGSSTATAMFAAAVTLMKTHAPRLNSIQLRKYIDEIARRGSLSHDEIPIWLSPTLKN